jgi:hypothetical protein
MTTKQTKRSKGGAFGKGGKPKQRPKFAELPPDCQKIVAHLLKCFSEGLSQEISMDDGQVQQSMIELFDRGYSICSMTNPVNDSVSG